MADDVTEIWKNAGESRIVLQRYGTNNERRHEMIGGGRTFTISTAERQLNQNLAAGPELDVFMNGMLIPVQLPADIDEDVANNPNHLRDEQLPALFRLQWRAFGKRIDQISNTAVLERLLEIAPERDATVRQTEVIKTRIAALAPGGSTAVSIDEKGEARIRPVTPR